MTTADIRAQVAMGRIRLTGGTVRSRGKLRVYAVETRTGHPRLLTVNDG
jgi:hypothetical protein